MVKKITLAQMKRMRAGQKSDSVSGESSAVKPRAPPTPKKMKSAAASTKKKSAATKKKKKTATKRADAMESLLRAVREAPAVGQKPPVTDKKDENMTGVERRTMGRDTDANGNLLFFSRGVCGRVCHRANVTRKSDLRAEQHERLRRFLRPTIDALALLASCGRYTTVKSRDIEAAMKVVHGTRVYN
jgi:hypothetical protein